MAWKIILQILWYLSVISSCLEYTAEFIPFCLKIYITNRRSKAVVIKRVQKNREFYMQRVKIEELWLSEWEDKWGFVGKEWFTQGKPNFFLGSVPWWKQRSVPTNWKLTRRKFWYFTGWDLELKEIFSVKSVAGLEKKTKPDFHVCKAILRDGMK